MPKYEAPLDDLHFVLNEVLNVGQLKAFYPDFDTETMSAIFEEAAKFCSGVLQPLNQSGDAEGCTFNNGKVTTPKGFKEAYKAMCNAGWPSLACDPDYGGQGLPQTVNTVFEEMICSANLSFGMYPGLSRGNYDAIHLHGTD